METSKHFILSQMSIILLLCMSLASAQVSSHDDFLQCLTNASDPSHPISAAVFTSNNSSYPSVLQAYIRNQRFNTSTTPKPFVIITALHESHVQASVICGKKHGLQMKIRSGGHDYEGLSYVTHDVPFFVLDMYNLRSIDVNIEEETAWVQTGSILGEVYYKIAEKSNVHAFPAGICPTVGVGGHFSGAGYGNMMRKYGVTADHFVDAKMVDAKGRLLDRKLMGEDLFWAISGGGGASFGVIIAYKIKLVRVPETVTVFRVPRTLEQNATDIVYRWQHVAPNIDQDLFIRLVLDVVNASQNGSGNKTVRAQFLAMFLGDSDMLLSIMNKSFPELGLQKSDCIETSWIQSVLFWTDISIDTPTTILLDRNPSVPFLKRKSDYVKKPIPIEGLEGLWKKMLELEVILLNFNPYGGRMSEVPASEIPLPHRAGNLWKIQYVTNWNEEGTEAENHYLNMTQMLYDYMTPLVSKNPRQAYFNYRDIDLGINHHGKNSYLEGRAYGIKYFMKNFDRLVRVKTKVDPDDFFRNEQSIPLSPYKRR